MRTQLLTRLLGLAVLASLLTLPGCGGSGGGTSIDAEIPKDAAPTPIPEAADVNKRIDYKKH